jgi:hypothetical protein
MEYEEAIEKAEMFFEYQVECAEQIYELEKNYSTQEFKVKWDLLRMITKAFREKCWRD